MSKVKSKKDKQHEARYQHWRNHFKVAHANGESMASCSVCRSARPAANRAIRDAVFAAFAEQWNRTPVEMLKDLRDECEDVEPADAIIKELEDLEHAVESIGDRIEKLIEDLGGRALPVLEKAPAIFKSVTDLEVLDALAKFRIGSNRRFLHPPEEQIDKKVWARLKRLLEVNGGRWTTQGWFVFDTVSDLEARIKHMLDEGKLANRKKEVQAFYTPTALADRMARALDCAGFRVLEPSAGHGALADACMRAGAFTVSCIEQDEDAAKVLRDKGYEHTSCCDFMAAVGDPYARIIMNPPFAKDQYLQHINHALTLLAEGGILVTIIPGNHPNRDLYNILRGHKWSSTGLGRDAFKEAGTSIETAMLIVYKEMTRAKAKKLFRAIQQRARRRHIKEIETIAEVMNVSYRTAKKQWQKYIDDLWKP